MELKDFIRLIEKHKGNVYYHGRKCELTYFPEDKFCTLDYINDPRTKTHIYTNSDGVAMKINALFHAYLNEDFRFEE